MTKAREAQPGPDPRCKRLCGECQGEAERAVRGLAHRRREASPRPCAHRERPLRRAPQPVATAGDVPGRGRVPVQPAERSLRAGRGVARGDGATQPGVVQAAPGSGVVAVGPALTAAEGGTPGLEGVSASAGALVAVGSGGFVGPGRPTTVMYITVSQALW